MFAILDVSYDAFRFESFLGIRSSVPELIEWAKELKEKIPSPFLVLHPSEAVESELRDAEKDHYEIICLTKKGNILSQLSLQLRDDLEYALRGGLND